MIRVGIVGASGYAGAELLRLCLGHPELEVAWATAETQAGVPVAALYPNLAAAAPGMVFSSYDPVLADGLDVVFLALPHGRSATVVPDLVERARVIVDLAADFRLRDPAVYERWYAEPHLAPALLSDFVYGLRSCTGPSWSGPARWPSPAATRPLPPSPSPRWCEPG